MKKALMIIFLLLLSFDGLLAQSTEQIPSTQKFNKKGFINNGDIKAYEHEIISDYDGNLMLRYGTPIELPTDLGGELTVIYNNNVEHSSYVDYKGNYNRTPLSMNIGEWIIGYKGIALQTLNFEGNFQVSNSRWTNQGRDVGSDYNIKDIPFLIKGYHISNRLDVYQTPMAVDYIYILRADGSKIILKNASSNYSDTDGLYVEEGSNNYGYAIVENTGNLRKVYYKPGDGLTYYFEEEWIRFADGNLAFGTNSGGQAKVAKVLYLKSIRNRFGHEIKFDYTDYIGMVTLYWGRKALSNITCPTLSPNRLVDVQYNTSNTTLISINIFNHNTKRDMTLKMAGGGNYFGNCLRFRTPAATPEQDYLLDGEYYRNDFMSDAGRILYISEIIDAENRKDEILYSRSGPSSSCQDNYIRKYTNSYTDYNNTFIQMYFTLKPYLPIKLTTHLQKISTYEYYPQKYANLDKDYIYAQGINTNQIYNDNIGYAYRDCFTNFMLKKRIVKNYQEDGMPNKRGMKALSEEYQYSLNPQPGNDIINLKSRFVDDILTTITKNTTYYSEKIWDGGLAQQDNETIKKYYTKYNIAGFNNLFLEAQALIKLKKEIYENSQIVNSYYYNEGEVVQNTETPDASYYSGDFFLTKETTERGNGNNKYCVSKMFNRDETDTIVFNHAVMPGYNKLITKKETSNYQSGIKNERIYKNIYPQNLADISSSTELFTQNNKDFYYKIELLESDIASSTVTNETISKSKVEYNASNMPYKTIKYNPKNDNIKLENTMEYHMNAGATCYQGMLKSIQNDRGITQEYIYLQDKQNFNCKLFNSSLNKTINQPFIYRNENTLKPIGTIIKSNDRVYSETYMGYLNQLDLDFTIDINGFYSGYEYNKVGQLKIVFVPGSAIVSSTTNLSGFIQPKSLCVPTKEYIYTYETNTSDASQIVLKSFIRRDYTTLDKVETKEYYDSFGDLIKSSIKVDNGYKTKSVALYNFNHQPIMLKDTLGKRNIYKYDYSGRLLSESTPVSVDDSKGISYIYYILRDSLQLPNSSNVVKYNEKTVIIDAEGKYSAIFTDSLGRKVGTLSGAESVDNEYKPTIFVYDKLNRLAKVISPEGMETQYKYDEWGNINEKSTPDAGTYQYKYNKYGELRYERHLESDPAVVISHTYDPLGRLQTTGRRSSAWAGLNANDNSADDTNKANLLLVNIYDEITYRSEFPEVFEGFTFSETLNNTKGRLVVTAYRDKVGDSWKYKVYSYDPLGNVEKTYLKEL